MCNSCKKPTRFRIVDFQGLGNFAFFRAAAPLLHSELLAYSFTDCQESHERALWLLAACLGNLT